MKPRARRITIGAAVLGTVLVAVLVAVCGRSVRDHVEAWHFQITRDTRRIDPLPERNIRLQTEEDLLHFAADRLGFSVIVDPLQLTQFSVGRVVSRTDIRGILEKQGWRVLEQHFPRRAYVLVSRETSYQSMEWTGPSEAWIHPRSPISTGGGSSIFCD